MGPTRWLNADEQRTWRAFLATNQLLFDRLDRELQADSGMSHASYEILVGLSESPDRAMRMSDLAGACLSSRSRVSHAVDRLERLGWVQRVECPSDRRGAFAVLTAEGFAELDKAARGHVEAVRRSLFDQLSDAQVKQLREICERVVTNLTDDNPDACRAYGYPVETSST